MKTAKLLAVAIATFASLPLMAQQVSTSSQNSTSTSVAGSHVNSSVNANAGANTGYQHTQANGSANSTVAVNGMHGTGHGTEASASGAGYARSAADMRPVTGELEEKLDAKSARVGEPVVLKTTQKMETAEGVVIPKGSRLLGHVTEVQARAKGQENSSLGIVFDHAQLKNGQSLAIHSMIESVEPSQAAIAAAAMANEDANATAPSMGGGGPVMGGGRVGGGGLVGGGAGLVGGAGGAANGLVGHAGSVAGQAGADLGATTEGAVNTTGRLAGDATANVGRRGMHAGEGAAGNLTARATGIPGVMLAGSSSTATSGTLTTAKRNVHLESGTQMVLGVEAAGTR